VGGSPAWVGLTTLPIKLNIYVMKHYAQLWIRTDYLAQHEHRKMDLRFGTWSLYRSDSMKTVPRE
jgi:hypothetical protein